MYVKCLIMNVQNRVVVTGMGVHCAIASSNLEFCKHLYQGVCGERTIGETRFKTDSKFFRNNKGFTIDPSVIGRLAQLDHTLLSRFTLDIVHSALSDARIHIDPGHSGCVGLALGTSVGSSFAFMKYLKSKLQLEGDHDYYRLGFDTTGTISGNICKALGITGPVSIISTACAAGTNSIGRAFDFIKSGRCRLAIAGGVDIFSELTFCGFNSLLAISRHTCTPFDEKRDGLILGDGCGILILENLASALARGARIYAEIGGYSILNEAFHATGPNPNGEVPKRCIRQALGQSGLGIGDVDYINAHGTGTRANDDMELRAICDLFSDSGRPIYISSTKSMIGHTLGAAGSIELIATINGLYNSFIPPTIHLTSPIHAERYGKRICLVRDRAMKKDFDVAISNSFGFSGNVASVVVKKFQNV
jgi:3-oxoacyl-[acyl-carrier-protein] synthase II